MKKSKSIIAVIAVMALLTFVGCGEKDNDMNNTTQTPGSTTEDNYNNGTDNDYNKNNDADQNLNKDDAAKEPDSGVTDNNADKDNTKTN